MPLINQIKKIKKKYLFLGFIIVLLHTLVHFIYSGIYFPLNNIMIGQIVEEVEPLIKYLNGGEFKFNNQRQYGPFFIFTITPFMIFYDNFAVFGNLLLIFCYIIVIFAFYISYNCIFQSQDRVERKISFWILLFLWLNFSPLLYIITVRNVEIWELFLICLGFLMYTGRKYFWVGFSLASATLIKMMPAIFIFYYLFKNRMVFFYSIVCLLFIMALAHIIFGPSIGFLYLPFLLTRAIGSGTWAALFFENNSLKGFINKAFVGFKSIGGTGYYFDITPEAFKSAYIVIVCFQAVIISHLIWMALRKDDSKEKTIIQFSLVSVWMLILSPVAALEYSTLLLFAYSAGLYFVLYRDMHKYMYVLYGVSYLLVGNFVPLSLFVKIFPFKTLNMLTGNTKLLDMAEAYKTYGIPFFGYIFIAIFFILLLHDKGQFKTTDNFNKQSMN